MQRPRLLRVVEYKGFVSGQEYLARIADVKANHKTKRLQIQLEHLNSEQDGRLQEVILPLPIHPHGRTAAFFRACGINVRADAEIDPRKAVGNHLTVRFDQGVDGPIVSFVHTVREPNNGPSTR